MALDSNPRVASKVLTHASSEAVAKVSPPGATASAFTASAWSSVKLFSTSIVARLRTCTAPSAPHVNRRARSPDPT